MFLSPLCLVLVIMYLCTVYKRNKKQHQQKLTKLNINFPSKKRSGKPAELFIAEQTCKRCLTRPPWAKEQLFVIVGDNLWSIQAAFSDG